MMERKTFLVITGASRGIGRAMAVGFAAKLGPGSVIAVFARSGDHLVELKQEIESSNKQVTVHTTTVDLALAGQDWYETIFDKILKESKSEASSFQQAILINNAAGGVVMKRAFQYTDKNELDDEYSLNLTSPIMLTNHMLRIFSNDLTPHRYVVNISSSAAQHVTRSISTYSAGKAARLMFFRVLAAEEPSIRVLNYNPGYVDTELMTYLRNSTYDSELKDVLTLMKHEGMLLTAAQSAEFLRETLEKDEFVSGQNIDVPQNFPDQRT